MRSFAIVFFAAALTACSADTGNTGDTGPRDSGADAPMDMGPPPDITTSGCHADTDCDDGDPCTANLCDTTTNACGYRRTAMCCTSDSNCDDGNACTTDRCDTTAHTCGHTAVSNCCASASDCNDGNDCTRDSCDTSTHQCSTAPIADCCMNGATRPCYTGPSGTMGTGTCAGGTETCVTNRWSGDCVGEVIPASADDCNTTADENCDGTSNDGCACSGTATQSCYTGPVGTEDVGRCHGGTQTCGGGMWGACSGEVVPATEVCGDTIDQDCDGSDLACPPVNDDRSHAIPLDVTHAETTQIGSTIGATHDGPSVTCSCTSGPNVWFRFTLTSDSAVYVDTSGAMDLDTSLFLTDDAGTLVPSQTDNGQPNAGLCNDDSLCGGVTGWSSDYQARTWGFLRAGTYYIAVGGCGTGAFTIHLQNVPITEGSYFYETRINGEANTQTYLIGTNRHSGTCGGRISGEDVRWFVTCGAPQFFSLCETDGGAYVSRTSTSETTRWDPVLYMHSGITGVESVCSDTGGSGLDCRGRIGSSVASTTFDTVQGGARLNNVRADRGLNAILVDERARGSGMDYRLHYRITDR